MIRLIVNADDLGYSPQRDRGIFTAFDRGIVSSASLLANAANFAAAAGEARSCALPVGVHLNLSEGRALVGPIPGLTDASGNLPGKSALRATLLAGTFDRDAVQRELRTQISRVRDAGIEPDHLDTHQHCLLFPALTACLVEVAKASGISAMRLPLPAEPADSDPPGPLGRELALYRQLAPTARQTLRTAGLWSPDGVWGMPLLNRFDTAALAARLPAIPEGTWELMTHPGFCDPRDPFGGPEREMELAAMIAPAIVELAALHGIRLTSFGACLCAY